jgi:hypothetical protein
MRRTVGLVVLPVLLVVGLLGLAACGGDGSDTVEVVVPAGTQDRLDAGEDVVVMPERLELDVGDVLLIRNEDDVEQSVGPYTVAAGQEARFEFGVAGTYEGYCPLSEGDRYEIVVSP